VYQPVCSGIAKSVNAAAVRFNPAIVMYVVVSNDNVFFTEGDGAITSVFDMVRFNNTIGTSIIDTKILSIAANAHSLV
jgi:hypothetical protein